ncbi:MAG: universal stress protein [Nitrosarchaeum sp.]|nr:universal stress protein [Nitrosarchaeum sp.]
MDLKNILVAYDASGFSNRAFNSALDIAEPNKSKITLVTVVTGIYQPSIGFSMKLNKEVLEKQNKTLKKLVSHLQTAAIKKGIPLSLRILHNPSVSKAIRNYVKSHEFDLIVIGSHGRTGLNKVILGSVANDVAHNANVPVMVVK